MKFTIAFLLITSLQVSAKTFSQERITLKLSSAELKTALKQIERKSMYRFLYNNDVVSSDQKVNIDADNMPVKEILDNIFTNTRLTYRVLENNLVVISERNIEFADIKVSGRVTNANGEPVSAVTVNVKGSKLSTSTDANGNYSISVPEGATLVFSSVGFESQEVSVKGRNEINISLKTSTRAMDEVVVIGYGTASKRDLTGSIVKISGKEVADRPNVNPVSSLQAKVAGLSIVNSGTPGAEPDIRIRGTVSIGGIRPLYVVDGVFNDNINYLNPNDIESIEVLKDPSSLAIFGVRGATGVIAITTKKAKAGQISVNFTSNFGAKKLVDKIDMVDAAGFKTLYDEEQTNIGVPLNQRFDYTKWTGNTDWVDVMTRTGIFNNNNISVSASSDKNKFYMGIGNTIDEGVVKNERLEKIMLSINDEFKMSKFLKLGFTLNGIRQKNPFSQANGLLFDARRVLPISHPVDPTTGLYTELAIQRAQISNPYMNLMEKWNKEKSFETRMVGSVYAELNFTKNLSFRSTFYADMSNVDYRKYNPIIYTFNPSVGSNGTAYVDPNNRTTSVNQNSERWNKFQQDYILTYKNTFGDHGVTAIGGFTTYYNEYRGLFGSVSQRASGDSIPNDPRFWYVSNGFGDPTTRRANSGQWEKATVSALFRVLYNYKGKYMLNASFRRDGSSQISPANRWKSFYAVGGAWELTKEDFMANQKIFDFLKVKASYGVLGVQNTFGYDYPFYPSLQSGNTGVFGSQVFPAYSLAYEPQPNLTWENVKAQEFGFEFNALKNRLHVDFAYYNKRTEKIMNEVNLGAGRRRLDNVGTVVNKGIELAASWTQELKKDLVLTVSGNFTTYSNKVLSLGDRFPASEERPNQTEPGQPIGYFYGYVVEGIYQSYADKLASPVVQGYTYGPGDLKYKDVNGDGVITTADRTYIGNPTPDFAYGGSINLRYKGLDLTVDMGGVYGNEVYRYWGSSELPFTKFNYPAFKMNRWHGEGTSNWDPKLGDNSPINRLPSTYGIEDGSYFRIRNLQLGYNLDVTKLSKLHIKNFRVFVNAQNLKTWKKNSGYTPEFGGGPLSFGIDNGNGPLPAIFTGGVNITF
ncbi:MAG: TonB-dependent receptor [Ferruginibacter sp.]